MGLYSTGPLDELRQLVWWYREHPGQLICGVTATIVAPLALAFVVTNSHTILPHFYEMREPLAGQEQQLTPSEIEQSVSSPEARDLMRRAQGINVDPYLLNSQGPD